MDYSKKGKYGSTTIDATKTRELGTGSGADQRQMMASGYSRMCRVVDAMPAKQARKTEDKALKACYTAHHTGVGGLYRRG